MVANKKLQVPITAKLNQSLTKQSEQWGFGSVNDFARFVLHHFCTGNVHINFPYEQAPNLPCLDDETEARLALAMQDLKNNNYQIIKASKPNDLQNYVDKLFD